MYKDVRSMVRMSSGYSEELGVKVGVHCPLRFWSTLQHCASGFIQGVPHRLPLGGDLYADDLMISVESMEELQVKLKT